MRETWVRSLGCGDPLEKEMATHSSILAWKIHGRRRLTGYSPWGCKESDTTEWLKKKKKKKNRLKIHEKFSITFKPGSCQHLPSFKLCRSGKRDMNWMNRRESDTVSTFALHNALGRQSIPPATHDLAATSPRSWIYIPERKKMIKKKEIKKEEKERKEKTFKHN